MPSTRQCDDVVDVALLRRTATRTLPPQLRSTAVLTAALTEVWREWCTVAAAAHDASPSSLTTHAPPLRRQQQQHAAAEHAPHDGSGAAVRRVCARLSSQLKAIKSELVAHLAACERHCSSSSNNTKHEHSDHTEASVRNTPLSAAAQSRHCDDDDDEATVAHDIVASLLPSSPSCAHVDNNKNDNNDAGHARDTRRLARRVWVWCLVFALVTVDMDLLSSTLASGAALFGVSAGSNNSNGRRDDDDDDDAACEAAVVWHADAASRPACRRACVCDAQLLHACALLYSIIVHDHAAAERALRHWCTHWLQCDNDDDIDSDDDRNSDSGTTTARRFARWVLGVARAVACDDVVALHALVLPTRRHRDDDTSSSNNNNNNNNNSSACDGDADDDATPYGVVVLLLRMLAVHVRRRQWAAAAQLGNSFRPVAATTLDATRLLQQQQQASHTAASSGATTTTLSSACVWAQTLFLCHDGGHAAVATNAWPLPATLVDYALLIA